MYLILSMRYSDKEQRCNISDTVTTSHQLSVSISRYDTQYCAINPLVLILFLEHSERDWLRNNEDGTGHSFDCEICDRRFSNCRLRYQENLQIVKKLLQGKLARHGSFSLPGKGEYISWTCSSARCYFIESRCGDSKKKDEMAIGLYRNIPDYTWRLESSIARIGIQTKQRTDKYAY
ncbi:uncharacterized protein LOC126916865 [Bombus affinis]|uniref:uncharacterized protein LOC126916865 n=1 Tax=Bombus affinis TaxID=309941 RepID=UPI0021B71727|nr:uncharacterized protein LOC126916865 [Bombus affinis]